MARRGTLLVIVAGLSAMLASLTLTYLVSVRSRAGDGNDMVFATQARLLLYGACTFICEARGNEGPITTDGAYAADPYRGGVPPVGASRPYPLVPRQWPPLAIAADPMTQQWLENPTLDLNTGAGLVNARLIAHPGSPTDTWFRLHHVSGPAGGIAGTHLFIVTVGIGQTYGYRSWAEVSATASPAPTTQEQHSLNYAADIPDSVTFDEARAREHREFFEVTWEDPAQVGNPPNLAGAKPWFGRMTRITPLAVEPATW